MTEAPPACPEHGQWMVEGRRDIIDGAVVFEWLCVCTFGGMVDRLYPESTEVARAED